MALLSTAVPANAENWFYQIPEDAKTFEKVININVKFLGKGHDLIATFTMKDGTCTQYLVQDDNITHYRKCGYEDWLKFKPSN
jgi:hypothetical protein